MRRLNRLRSSSFQLAVAYVALVLLAMAGIYYQSICMSRALNERFGLPQHGEPLPNAYLFAQVAPLLIVVLLLIVGLSFFISEFVIKRLNAIHIISENIMKTGDLSRRIPIDSRWDDLSKLAMVLNAMLERIEQLVQETRTVADNIAHDLRTPLTRLKQQVESLQQEAEKDDHSLSVGLDKLHIEMEQMLATFAALLRIGHIERGSHQQRHERISLVALLEDACDMYEPLAEEKEIRLEMQLPPEPLLALVDRDLLFQAVVNLLDNAIKFTPAGGQVVLGLAMADKEISLFVADSGVGIPEDAYEVVTKRFARLDHSRHAPGNGLGLSLVKAVIERHGGRLSLSRAAQGGLHAALILPAGRLAG